MSFIHAAVGDKSDNSATSQSKGDKKWIGYNRRDGSVFQALRLPGDLMVVKLLALQQVLRLQSSSLTPLPVMPSANVMRSYNAARELANAHYLIVGGTSGIGRATAIQLARMSASVTIAGRNAVAGAEVVSELKTLNPSGTHEFQPIDMTLLSDVRRFCKAYTAAHDALSGVVVSAGIMTLQGRTETSEGIDQKMAVHYYARALLIRELEPLLEKTKAADGSLDVRVLTVLNPTRGAVAFPKDLDLKTSYSLTSAAESASAYNDLAMNELAIRHPSISHIHMSPGIVSTGLMRDLPFYLRWAGEAVAAVAGQSLESCGDAFAYAMTAPEYKTGWWLLSSKADVWKPNGKYHTDENRKNVWAHTEKIIGA
ncbi:hypothetical protein HKX48_007561 [Thoreauomyces humboldtii]|nr:hypothetical protein HKX48_007561 [Thoreauomyces humboldtii]